MTIEQQRNKMMAELGEILPEGFAAHRGLIKHVIMVREKGSWSMGCPVQVKLPGGAKVVNVYYLQLVVTLLAFWPAFLILVVVLPGLERAKAAANLALAQIVDP